MTEPVAKVSRALASSSLVAVAPRPPRGEDVGGAFKVGASEGSLVSASRPPAPLKLGGFPWACYENHCPHPAECVLNGCPHGADS